MADLVDVHTATRHLSRLLKRVEAGEEITLVRAGRPIAMLVPYRALREPRKPGLWKDRVTIRDDFDDPLPEFEAMDDE